jgi:hypothetical protein
MQQRQVVELDALGLPQRVQEGHRVAVVVHEAAGQTGGGLRHSLTHSLSHCVCTHCRCIVHDGTDGVVVQRCSVSVGSGLLAAGLNWGWSE